MTNPTWELVKIARTRAMADRLQQDAFERAEAAGFQTGDAGHYGYMCGWLAHESARRIVELEDARGGARASAGTPSISGVIHRRPADGAPGALEDAARAHGGSPAAPHTPLPEGAAGTPRDPGKPRAWWSG